MPYRYKVYFELCGKLLSIEFESPYNPLDSQECDQVAIQLVDSIPGAVFQYSELAT